VARTLIIGSDTGVWRDWLRQHREGRELLSFDPADADLGLPGRLAAYDGDTCSAWRFYGSLSPQRAPHVLMAGLSALIRNASADAIVELFPYRPGPLRLQLARACAEAIGPGEILADRRAQLEKSGWPARLQEVELPEAAPPGVRAGQRKARWMRMLDDCEPHELNLRHVALDGLRLGSGTPMPLENLRKWGFSTPLHAEVAGNVLLIVAESEVGDVEVSRALDGVHASKAVVVSPQAYECLICAFARESGEDFGMGRVERIEFPEMIAHVRCTAVGGSPVSLLRVGSIRLDSDGRELPEAKPWEL
jgi:polynucleotide 5'-kinase involved in rRNA processing